MITSKELDKLWNIWETAKKNGEELPRTEELLGESPVYLYEGDIYWTEKKDSMFAHAAHKRNIYVNGNLVTLDGEFNTDSTPLLEKLMKESKSSYNTALYNITKTIKAKEFGEIKAKGLYSALLYKDIVDIDAVIGKILESVVTEDIKQLLETMTEELITLDLELD